MRRLDRCKKGKIDLKKWKKIMTFGENFNTFEAKMFKTGDFILDISDDADISSTPFEDTMNKKFEKRRDTNDLDNILQEKINSTRNSKYDFFVKESHECVGTKEDSKEEVTILKTKRTEKDEYLKFLEEKKKE